MRQKSILGSLALFLLASGALANEAPVDLEKLAELPEFRHVSLSPDGQHVALGAPADDQTGLVVLDISDPERLDAINALQIGSNEHVSDIHWADADRVLFETARQEGALAEPQPTGRLYMVETDGDRAELVHDGGTGEGMVPRQAGLLSLLPDEPDLVMIIDRAADRGPRALYLDLESGRTSRAALSPFDGGGLLADSDGEVRFAYYEDEDGEPRFSYRDSAEDDWSEDFAFDLDLDLRWMNIHGFDGSGDGIYFSTRETGEMGLYRLDTETGDTEQKIDTGDVEVSQSLWDEDRDRVIGVVVEDGHPEMRFIDEDAPSALLQRQIAEAFPGEFSRIVSFADDADLAVVAAESDITPTGFYLFDTEDLAADYLIATREGLDPQQLRPTEPFSFEARDDMKLHGYVTEPEEDGPHPTVVLIHGGPHGIRDSWSFEAERQILATHGYAVVQVNFRGSGGYGHEYETAGYQRWGAEMQDDITDATYWAIEEGIADEDRICLFGGSYGAFSTLSGLVREPALYACGIATAGVYDLPLMKEDGDIPESPQGQAYLERVLGTDEDDLIERSPVRHVENLEAPLLITHGDEDVRTPMSQYEMLVERLDEVDAEYEDRVFEGEGHGYFRDENRIEYYELVLDFLDRQIGD